MSIELRMVAPEDHGFLYSVYASTRADEMRLANWDTRQIEAFLRMQFGAQLAFYAEHYPNARYQIILLDGQRAGRLYTDWWASEIRIMDIALLPEYRGRGIGSTVLTQFLKKHGPSICLSPSTSNGSTRLCAGTPIWVFVSRRTRECIC